MSQHNTQGRQGQGARRRYNKGGRSYGNDRRDSSGYRPKYRKEAPAKLSLWQRFLGLFGIRPSKNNKHAARDKAAAKTNTRVARNRQDRVSAPKQPVSNRRLYVGNLSYEATESDLEDVFKGIGEVNSVEIIYNPRTHKSKGYAFVEMKKMEDAIRSVDILHNQPFMGRNLLVSGANERQEQPRQPREDRAPREEQDSMAEVKEPHHPTALPSVGFKPLPCPSRGGGTGVPAKADSENITAAPRLCAGANIPWRGAEYKGGVWKDPAMQSWPSNFPRSSRCIRP